MTISYRNRADYSDAARSKASYYVGGQKLDVAVDVNPVRASSISNPRQRGQREYSLHRAKRPWLLIAGEVGQQSGNDKIRNRRRIQIGVGDAH